MSFKIAVVSGKGGTGKTTVSISLMHYMHQMLNTSVHLVDCDVEEPNDALFFSDKVLQTSNSVYQDIPEINTDKCSFCRQCSDYCVYNALVIIPSVRFAQVETALCHSCGACSVACKDDAITLRQELIGEINHYVLNEQMLLSEGELKVGSAMQTMLIKSLKKSIETLSSITIFDAPPGTSCSVVETISDSDLVVIVAEPTPFGVHDMELTIQLVQDMNKPFGVVVNKAGMGTDAVFQILENYSAELFGTIPFDKNYAKEYAVGQLMGGEQD
ncbi:MAG: P-loop NTPase, partial [Bacteroidales bacterium]|nr:P-loop NTPase [Bacteroidales bacterium]